MSCDALRDDQWERLKPFVPGGSKGKRGPRSNNRRFLDALLWMARSGGRWRDLPAERFGPYQTVKRRYYRWVEKRRARPAVRGGFQRALLDFPWTEISSTAKVSMSRSSALRS
jgi:transposase